MPEATKVRQMFSGIADCYDRANRTLSFYTDIIWRKKLTKLVQQQQPHRVVDLATGSGDVAFALRDRLGADVSIEGYDFCEEMLVQARHKKASQPAYRDIPFRLGDCLALPLEDQSVDAITISFGYRNLENRPAGLREMLRVLRPGGSLFILEFTQPYAWFRPFYYLYLKYILPPIARLVTGNVEAYHYLAGSIESFPSRQNLSAEISQAGFLHVVDHPMTFSTVAIHHAIKAI